VVDLFSSEHSGIERSPLKVASIRLADSAGELHHRTGHSDGVLRRSCDLDGMNAPNKV